MESLGEVGVMNMGADTTGDEILKTLLSASKGSKPEELTLNVLAELPNGSEAEEQLVLQVQVPESVVQEIPITYLTTESSDLVPVEDGGFGEPVTYVLSRDVLEEGRVAGVGESEAQKIILVQDVEANAPPGGFPEGRELVKERGSGELSELWEMGGPNCEMVGGGEGRTGQEERKWMEMEGGEGMVGLECGGAGDGEATGSSGRQQRKTTGGKGLLGKKKSLKGKNKSLLDGLMDLEEGQEGGEERRPNLFELTRLEDNVEQVAERLKMGCECVESNCFDGLDPEDVFRHRLNLADLTKAEHDMFLMGVITASIHNLDETYKHKERVRVRCCYAYQGKRVCLTAFLYLQHANHYQMKSLRRHLKTHGVSPRVHGNRGRKPANTLPLDMYQSATDFVQSYIERHCMKTGPGFSPPSPSRVRGVGGGDCPGKEAYHLPPECTRRGVHQEYMSFCEGLNLTGRMMMYSTFTNFLKKEFPNVRFYKKEERKQERWGWRAEWERWGSGGEEEGEEGLEKGMDVEKECEYVPMETKILVDGEEMELFRGREESEGDAEFGGEILVESDEFGVREAQVAAEFFGLGDSIL